MIGRIMDLRPDDVRRRVRDANERLRVARFAVVAGGLLCVAWVGASWRLSAARAELVTATERAEHVVQVEAQLREARAAMDRRGRELSAWRRVTVPLGTAQLVDRIVEVLPESATIESFELDATSLIAVPAGFVRSESGPTESPRRVSGEIDGFAASDEDVARFVDALRARPFFRGVRVVTTRHRELGGADEVAREFRIAFEVDLDAASPAPSNLVTDEEENSR